MANTLPDEVVTKDNAFERIHEAALFNLAELRWHWTLGLPERSRVSFSEYGRRVGRSKQLIRDMARGYEEWLRRTNVDKVPCQLSDCIELVRVKPEDRPALEAHAAATGLGMQSARRSFSREQKLKQQAIHDTDAFIEKAIAAGQQSTPPKHAIDVNFDETVLSPIAQHAMDLKRIAVTISMAADFREHHKIPALINEARELLDVILALTEEVLA